MATSRIAQRAAQEGMSVKAFLKREIERAGSLEAAARELGEYPNNLRQHLGKQRLGIRRKTVIEVYEL